MTWEGIQRQRRLENVTIKVVWGNELRVLEAFYWRRVRVLSPAMKSLNPGDPGID